MGLCVCVCVCVRVVPYFEFVCVYTFGFWFCVFFWWGWFCFFVVGLVWVSFSYGSVALWKCRLQFRDIEVLSCLHVYYSSSSFVLLLIST